jgi:tetratricopeptide (TPR) repeat protein
MGFLGALGKKEDRTPEARVLSSFFPSALTRRQWLGVLLAAMTLVSYCGVFGNDFVDYDDNGYVFNNSYVQEGLTGASIIWAFESRNCANWHPLTWLSLELDSQVFGLAPWGFHLTNLLLHTANVLLLFWLLDATTGQTWRSAVVAGLFAVHPLHVESVAWVAERKDVLSTFFGLLALHSYARHVRSPDRRWYLLVVLAFALSLLAKPMLVTLPLVLLLLDYWSLHRLWAAHSSADIGPVLPGTALGGAHSIPRQSLKGLLLEKVPLLLLAAASCGVTLYVQLKGGATDALKSLTLTNRIENAVVAYAGYLDKMVWPSGLAVLYPHPRDTLTAWQVARATLLLAVITLGTLMTARRHPYLLVGWLWYLGTLVPVIGLVQVGAQAMADRYTYVPLIGVFIMVVWGSADLARRWRLPRVVPALVAGGVLLACAVLTVVQVSYWYDTFTLWSRAAGVTTNNHIAQHNLGSIYLERNNLGKARSHLTEALRIVNRMGIADADDTHLSMGRLEHREGRRDQAIQSFARALKINPYLSGAHYALGKALFEQGYFARAIAQCSQVEPEDDGYADACAIQGMALYCRGKPQAIDKFRAAVGLQPQNPWFRLNLALVLHDQGWPAESAREFREALRLCPDCLGQAAQQAWNLATHPDPQRRDPGTALVRARQVLLAPGAQSSEALDTLAVAYAALGRFQEATSTGKKALCVARTGNDRTLMHQIRHHVALFENHQPFVRTGNLAQPNLR